MNAWAASRGDAGRIEIVASPTRLDALVASWWALWRADPRATPFQSPAWLLPWARHYAPGRFAAIVWHRHGALTGLLPVFHWRGRLLLAGTGPSDYGDALVAAGVVPQAGSVLLAALADAADRFDCGEIDLRQLRPCSPLLGGSAPRGWHDMRESDLPCPVLPLRAGDPFADASGHWRRNLRRAERLMRDAGAEIRALADAEIDSAAATLDRLHRQRWSARGEGGVIDPRLRRFLHEAIPALHESGLLRFRRVMHGSTIVAAAFAMRGTDAVHCYLGGFDPAWARASPGLVVIADAIRAAAREGMHEFHLLRGREAYKYGFGAEDCPTLRRRLVKTAHLAVCPA